MLPSNDRGRPAANGTPPKVSITTADIHMVPPSDGQIRCSRCGHVVWSEESIRLELGPVCRRIVGNRQGVAA